VLLQIELYKPSFLGSLKTLGLLKRNSLISKIHLLYVPNKVLLTRRMLIGVQLLVK